MTQGDDILLDYLSRSHDFEPKVVVSPARDGHSISYQRYFQSLMIKIPSRTPRLLPLEEKGFSLSPLVWLELILRSARILGSSRFDIGWCGGNLTLASMGWLLKKLGLCRRLVYHDGDYYPLCYNGLAARMAMIFLERLVIGNSDLVISISEEIATIRRTQGAKKVGVIPTGVDHSFFKRAYCLRTRRIDQGRMGRTILYAGNFNAVLDDLLLDSLTRVHERLPDFVLRIVGSGDRGVLNRFVARAKQRGFDNNIQTAGFVTKDELPSQFSLANIGLAKLKQPELALGTTQKVLQYLAAGLPVLASAGTGAGSLIQGSGAGFVCAATADQVSDTLIKMLTLPKEEYIRMSRKAVEYAENFDWSSLARKYADLMKRLVS